MLLCIINTAWFIFLCIALNEDIANTNVSITFSDHGTKLHFESTLSNVTVIYPNWSNSTTFPCDFWMNTIAGEEYMMNLTVSVGNHSTLVDIQTRFRAPQRQSPTTPSSFQSGECCMKPSLRLKTKIRITCIIINQLPDITWRLNYISRHGNIKNCFSSLMCEFLKLTCSISSAWKSCW